MKLHLSESEARTLHTELNRRKDQLFKCGMTITAKSLEPILRKIESAITNAQEDMTTYAAIRKIDHMNDAITEYQICGEATDNRQKAVEAAKLNARSLTGIFEVWDITKIEQIETD